mgnify:CR=1 FL=1
MQNIQSLNRQKIEIASLFKKEGKKLIHEREITRSIFLKFQVELIILMY